MSSQENFNQEKYNITSYHIPLYSSNIEGVQKNKDYYFEENKFDYSKYLNKFTETSSLNQANINTLENKKDNEIKDLKNIIEKLKEEKIQLSNQILEFKEKLELNENEKEEIKILRTNLQDNKKRIEELENKIISDILDSFFNKSEMKILENKKIKNKDSKLDELIQQLENLGNKLENGKESYDKLLENKNNLNAEVIELKNINFQVINDNKNLNSFIHFQNNQIEKLKQKEMVMNSKQIVSTPSNTNNDNLIKRIEELEKLLIEEKMNNYFNISERKVLEINKTKKNDSINDEILKNFEKIIRKLDLEKEKYNSLFESYNNLKFELAELKISNIDLVNNLNHCSKHKKNISGVSTNLSFKTKNNEYKNKKLIDIEDELKIEKLNAEKMLEIKDKFIEKLKSTNSKLSEQLEKIHKEFYEEKIKFDNYNQEIKTQKDKESYLKIQIENLSNEIFELKIKYQNETFEKLIENFKPKKDNLNNSTLSYNLISHSNQIKGLEQNLIFEDLSFLNNKNNLNSNLIKPNTIKNIKDDNICDISGHFDVKNMSYNKNDSIIESISNNNSQIFGYLNKNASNNFNFNEKLDSFQQEKNFNNFQNNLDNKNMNYSNIFKGVKENNYKNALNNTYMDNLYINNSFKIELGKLNETYHYDPIIFDKTQNLNNRKNENNFSNILDGELEHSIILDIKMDEK